MARRALHDVHLSGTPDKPDQQARRTRARHAARADSIARRGQCLPALYQGIVEMAPDATVVVDAGGCIQLVNRQTEALFGYRREELLGQVIEILLPERFHAAHRQHRADYLATPRTRLVGAGLPLVGRRCDGSEFPVEVSLALSAPAEAPDGSLLIASIRDVSDLQRVQAANQELCRMQALTDTALAHLELDDLLPRLLGRVRDVMAVDNVAILLLDAAGQELRIRAACGPEEQVASTVHVPLGKGFAGRIASTREPLLVEDLSTFPVANPFLHDQLRSVVGVPLLLRERVLGVLHIGTAEPHHFTERDVDLLQRVGERVTMAIERAQLYEHAQAARAAEQHARQEAEAALAAVRLSEERLRLFIEHAPVAVAMFDRELRYLALSRRWRHDYGLEGDLLGRSHYDVLPEIPERWKAIYRRCLTGAEVKSEEDRFERRDGSVQWLKLEVRPWYRGPDAVGGLVIFSEDITERKQLKREREEARASALVAQEVAEQLDQFFAMASHDIRTPVTALNGNLEMVCARAQRLVCELQARGTLDPQLIGPLLMSLERADESSVRLVRLVRLLFDVVSARIGTLRLTLASCDLVTLIREEVAAQLMSATSRSIQMHLPNQPIQVMADADRVRQVVANYLINGLKFSAADQPVAVRLEVRAGQVMVSVEDHGPGLPPEEQSRVWELYHRVPGVEAQSTVGASSGSLGAGLYICKRLIELHPGGHVGVESVVGQGSTFWFSLPLHSAED